MGAYKGKRSGGKQYDDTNRGVLFKNDRKEKDTQPDLTGKINVNGTEYWLSAWTNKDEQGKFQNLKLSVREKEEVADAKHEPRQAPKAAPQAKPAPDDEIPF